MRTTETSKGRLTRQLLAALSLALALTFTGAAVAMAAQGQPSGQRQAVQDSPAERGDATAGEAAPGSGAEGVSPVVPLVFAGILLLAATPALPRPAYRWYSRMDQRW